MEKDKLNRVRSLLTEDRESRMQAQLFSRDLLNLVMSAVEGAGSPKLSKAVAIGSAAFTIGSAMKGFWALYKKSHNPQTFVIKITEDDAIFEIVEDWFMDALPEEAQRSVYAHSVVTRREDAPRRRFSGSDMEGTPSADENRVTIDYSFDGTMAQEVEIAGHKVQVFTVVPDGYGQKKDGGGGNKSFWNSRSINIECDSVEARNAVLKEIEDASQYLVESQPKMYVSSRYGDWRKRSDIQKRSLGSVVLKEGQMERIITYLKDFLKYKDAYTKADIPFRTGILLYGEPGSGKSSTALAIANELKMNVFIIPITALSNDESLADCFGSIPPNSIIIIEDIDIAKAVQDRDAEDDGVTMQGMLNVLDGFQSPPGVITIMTTNRLDVLDPAIIRPGRVDMTENLDCLDTYQLRGLCEYFMGHIPEDLPTISSEDGITSAELMGVIRKHLPDFADAGDDVVKFVTDRVLTKMDSSSKV